MEIENPNLLPPNKCAHGVYRPSADPIAYSCQMCNPDGTGDGAAPQLPRSSADPLNADKTDKLETCSCGNMRTYFSKDCVLCGKPFPVDDERGRAQGSANAHQAGVCPACSSTVHYDNGAKWQCADCDTVYPAPKRVTGMVENES